MSKRFWMAAALLALAAGGLAAGQEQEPPLRDQPPPVPELLFVRLTLYPTASLSRYDYNNDVDLYEVRVYADVRLRSPEGKIVPDALITVLSQRLDFVTDHYEKKIVVDKDALPEEAVLEIAAGNRAVLHEVIPLPAWLILQDPRPAIYEAGREMAIRWRFSRFAAPVDVHAYDFRKGGEFFRRDHASETEFIVPGDKVPVATILRIFVIQSWLSKRFLSEEGLARGSEVIVIPWSQVFVRTK